MLFQKKSIWLGLVFVFLSVSVLADPSVVYVSPPTPDSDAVTDSGTFSVEATVTGVGSMKSLVWQWNGADYVMYDRTNLVLMMNFDDVVALGEDAGTVVDLSKYGTDGTLFEGVGFGLGKYGGAFTFDGVDDYVKGSASHLPADDRTVSFWFYVTDAGDVNYGMFGYGGSGCGDSFFIFLSTDLKTLNVHGHCSAGAFEYTAPSSLAGVWHHLTVTTSSTERKIYVDGVLGTTAEGAFPSTYVAGRDYAIGIITGSSFSAGGAGFAPATFSNIQYFKGKIDELRVYDRAFSAAEVEQVYNSNLNKYSATAWTFVAAEQGLVAGEYTYKVSVTDTDDNAANSGQRTITSTYIPAVPEFSVSALLLAVILSTVCSLAVLRTKRGL